MNSSSSDVKRSYFHLLSFFLQDQKVESRFVTCLIKWGIQLGIDVSNTKDLEMASTSYVPPANKTEKLEALYHLVYMIYLDKVMEDVELELACAYAEKLGFEKNMVGDLFKSIATIPYDRATPQDVKKEVEDFLKVQGY
jgi:hypothetical protein